MGTAVSIETSADEEPGNASGAAGDPDDRNAENDASPNAQELADVQMLSCLRHDAFIGGDHQTDQI